MEIKLSVIIPTRNRANLVKDVLDSLCCQTLQPTLFEVLVIDNGSSDNTVAVVESFKDKLPNLSMISEPRPGLHRGRHAGYKNALGDILVFADDDIIAFPTWLEGIWESMQDENVMLVGGKDLPKYEAPVPFWVKEKWYQMQPEGHAMPELSLIDLGDNVKEISPYYVYGCNYAIRRKVLDETNGFHPDGVPFEMIEYRGDGEWYVNIYIAQNGYKVIYNPRASVYHRVTAERLCLDYFKKRAFCAGVEHSYADCRYGTHYYPIVPNGLNLLLRCRYIKSQIKIVLNNIKMSNIDKEIEKSHRIGYEYHNTMYHNNPQIKEWVHKDNYLY